MRGNKNKKKIKQADFQAKKNRLAHGSPLLPPETQSTFHRTPKVIKAQKHLSTFLGTPTKIEAPSEGGGGKTLPDYPQGHILCLQPCFATHNQTLAIRVSILIQITP
jgi:hypothetical protein